jgi:hypothetical protein
MLLRTKQWAGEGIMKNEKLFLVIQFSQRFVTSVSIFCLSKDVGDLVDVNNACLLKNELSLLEDAQVVCAGLLETHEI